MINYELLVMDRREKLRHIVMAALALLTVGFIFFNNMIIASLVALGAFYYPVYKTKELIAFRKKELNLQFKDALYSLASSLSVGQSLESAFYTALKDLRVLYPDTTTYIVTEFEYICRKLELNQPVELALEDFAKRSGLEDIKNFAEVILICKRTGGNLVQVVKNTSSIIGDKIEINNEIDVLLTKQKFEQKILNLMPIVFIGLVRFGGSGYMDPLYEDPRGYLLMLLALGILFASWLVSKKIFDIKV